MVNNLVNIWSNGRRLYGVVNKPSEKGSTMPCVIMCHGYCGFRDENGAYEQCAKKFCESGIGVLRFDFSGCGESVVPQRRGHMLCATQWIEDIYNVYEFVKTLEWVDKSKISTFGMSMGGMAVLSSVKSLRGLYSAVAISPVNDGFEWLHSLWANSHGEAAFEAFINRVNQETGRRVTFGTDDFAEVAEILAFSKADLKVFLHNAKSFPLTATKASWSSAYEILSLVNAHRELLSSTYDTPVLFIHGDSDTLVDCKGTQKAYEGYQFGKRLAIFEGQDHGLLFSNEFNSFFPEVCSWVSNNEYRNL